MKSCYALTVALLGMTEHVASFGYTKLHQRTFLGPLTVSRNDNDPVAEAYFQMKKIPTATTGARLDQFVECAQEGGQCNVAEMGEMIEELDRLNLKCQDSTEQECNLDVQAARNVLKVALASKVALESAMVDDECNPYSDMYLMNDECFNAMQKIPTATGNNLGRIVECAEGQQSCDLDEMTQMIEELERLNMDCENALSRECNLEAVEARNILKVALASQVAMQEAFVPRK